MFRAAVLVSFFCGGLLLNTHGLHADSNQERNSDEIRGPVEDRPLVGSDLDIPEAEREIIKLMNKFRKEQGRPAVESNIKLHEAARAFAEFLAKTDRFSHEADGSHPWDRAEKHGYEYCIVLENIGMEFRADGFTADGLAKALVEGWKNSPAHRQNMMDADVTDTGVGVAHSSETGKYFGVQMFGRPESEQIVFQVSNQSGAPVRLKLDDRVQTLEPRSTATFTRCRPPALTFQPAGGEAGATPVYHPKKGSHCVIEKAADDQIFFQVKEE